MPNFSRKYHTILAMIVVLMNFGCKSKNQSSVQSEDFATNAPAEDIEFNEACVAELEVNPNATCNVFDDPMARVPNYAVNVQPRVDPNELESGNQTAYAFGEAEVMEVAKTACAVLRDRGTKGFSVRVSLGAEYSNVLMNEAEKIVWAAIKPGMTVERLANELPQGQPEQFKMFLQRNVAPILEKSKGINCSDLVQVSLFYSKDTITSRVANLVNRIVARIPFTDAGYRRNGNQRIVSVGLRNMMLNRADRGVGIYKGIRDQMIAKALQDADGEVNSLAGSILRGTPLRFSLRVHEFNVGYFWLFDQRDDGKDILLSHGRVSDAIATYSQAVADINRVINQVTANVNNSAIRQSNSR